MPIIRAVFVRLKSLFSDLVASRRFWLVSAVCVGLFLAWLTYTGSAESPTESFEDGYPMVAHCFDPEGREHSKRAIRSDVAVSAMALRPILSTKLQLQPVLNPEGRLVVRSSAASTGLMPNDTLVAINGQRYASYRVFVELLQTSLNEVIRIDVDRGKTRVSIHVYNGACKTEGGGSRIVNALIDRLYRGEDVKLLVTATWLETSILRMLDSAVSDDVDRFLHSIALSSLASSLDGLHEFENFLLIDTQPTPNQTANQAPVAIASKEDLRSKKAIAPNMKLVVNVASDVPAKGFESVFMRLVDLRTDQIVAGDTGVTRAVSKSRNGSASTSSFVLDVLGRVLK